MTELIEIRLPTDSERKRGAEAVFIRARGAQEFTICACRCYESWEQWGAPADVLGDNIDDVEQWRRAYRRVKP